MRGHLLNDNIGGPGHSWANLAPIRVRANSQMETRFERRVKQAVLDGEAVRFRVEAR